MIFNRKKIEELEEKLYKSERAESQYAASLFCIENEVTHKKELLRDLQFRYDQQTVNYNLLKEENTLLRNKIELLARVAGEKSKVRDKSPGPKNESSPNSAPNRSTITAYQRMRNENDALRKKLSLPARPRKKYMYTGKYKGHYEKYKKYKVKRGTTNV